MIAKSTVSRMISRGAPLASPRLQQRGAAGLHALTFPPRVRIVEVGPRDGLQNEKSAIVPTHVKVELITRLKAAGLSSIEAGSFVRADWVPQMADTPQVLRALREAGKVDLKRDVTVLTPNAKGLAGALEAGVGEVAVFGAASESFSQKNINTSIDKSLANFEVVAKDALKNGLRVRGYVSCVLGCPYEGVNTDPERVLHVTRALLGMGCYEVSLGDTIGTGNPASTSRLLNVILSSIPVEKIAVHFHDTYGAALANIATALQHGVTSVDSSVSGLGGCPYAKGATGNVATEDVLSMLHGMGVSTGVDLDQVVRAGEFIDAALNRTTGSKAALALRHKLKACAPTQK